MRLRALILLLLVAAGPLAAQAPQMPSPFPARDIPDAAPDGTPATGFRLRAAFVTRMADGEWLVMYGYVLAPGRTAPSLTYLRNDALNIACWSRTVPRADMSARAATECYEAGRRRESLTIEMPPGTYGRLRGTVTGRSRRADGTPFSYVLRWQPFGFPDPAPLMDALR